MSEGEREGEESAEESSVGPSHADIEVAFAVADLATRVHRHRYVQRNTVVDAEDISLAEKYVQWLLNRGWTSKYDA